MELESANDSVLGDLRQLDICGWSVLHCLFTRPPIQKVTFLKSYLIPWLITAFLFYGLPFIVVWRVAPNNLVSGGTSGLKVGYLDDWNVMFMNLVTLPVLVIFTLSERSMVPKRIVSIIQGRITPDAETSARFVRFWNRVYKGVNLFGQCAGVVVAVAVSMANYKAALPLEEYTGWQVSEGNLNGAGWMFLCWQIPCFYWITSIYASQGLATIGLLFSLTRHFRINVLPFHHDNCCGLKTVGYIGLRNQYLLAVVGMNLLALAAVNYKRGDPNTVGLLVAGIVAYVTLGPIVFIGPLLPFRKSMLLAKEAEQEKVATKLQHEYGRIMTELENRSMAKEDEELIDRLQKLKALVNRIPVWPFDTTTLRRFFTVYIFPVLTGLVSILVSYLVSVLKGVFGG